MSLLIWLGWTFAGLMVLGILAGIVVLVIGAGMAIGAFLVPVAAIALIIWAVWKKCTGVRGLRKH